MTIHDADVAAVLAEGIRIAGVEQERNHCSPLRNAEAALAALTAAGYAVVKLPKGVAVAHGARLVRAAWLYVPELEGRCATYRLDAIEATP